VTTLPYLYLYRKTRIRHSDAVFISFIGRETNVTRIISVEINKSLSHWHNTKNCNLLLFQTDATATNQTHLRRRNRRKTKKKDSDEISPFYSISVAVETVTTCKCTLLLTLRKGESRSPRLRTSSSDNRTV